MTRVLAALGWLAALFLLRRSWVDWHAGWEEGVRAAQHREYKRGWNAALDSLLVGR